MSQHKILLHACCGPCSLEPTRLLQQDGVEFSLYYANSNIHPQVEYEHRLQTISDWAATQNITFVAGAYQPEVWEESAGKAGEALERLRETLNLQAELVDAPNPYPLATAQTNEADFCPTEELQTPEAARVRLAAMRAARCRACYRLRFEESCAYAKENGYDSVGTTLSVSPFQYTNIIQEELESACAKYELQCAFVDYRPFFQANEERSKELGMYRQNFCGCHFSDKEAQLERTLRKAARKAAKAARKAHKNSQGA